MTQRFKRLSHSIYECKYHIVFCPKYRYRIFKDEIGEYARQQVYQLCGQKEQIEVLELNVLVSIGPKYAVSEFMGYLKGKKALRLFQEYESLGRSPMGERLLCQHSRIGRRKDTQICAVAREAGKASRNCARQVVRLALRVVARLPGVLF